jgi:tRNA-guanine family transglycosylase
MFAEEWRKEIDVLISAFDLLNSDASRFDLLTRYGVQRGINETRRYYARYLRSQFDHRKYYRDYYDFCKGDLQIRNRFLIDSGGFGFTYASENRSELSPRLRPFMDLYESNPKKAQQRVLETQLALHPFGIITLDKVIHPMDNLSVKCQKTEFSLACAKEALALRSTGRLQKVKLFAAVHGYGLKPNGQITPRDLRVYYRSTCEYMRKLLDIEDTEGETFDVFSVGSLVPITSEKIVETIASAVSDTLKENGRTNPIHGLGASTRTKIESLTRHGFTIFDTNLHVKKARYRQIYDPSKGAYVSVSEIDGRKWNCKCGTCSRHSWQMMNESRRGMKEVSTVLVSLHNFFTDQIPMAAEISIKQVN